MTDTSEEPDSSGQEVPKPDEDAPAGLATEGPTEPAESDEGRRGALKLLVGVGSVAYAAVLAVPAYRFAVPEGGGGGDERWIRVEKLSAVSKERPTRVKVLGDNRDAFTLTPDEVLGTVWLQREGDNVTVLSSECPHLGCAIALTSDGKNFSCPCHTSLFSLDGKAQAGPSPRAMDPLKARVVDGWVEVDFRRFRIGKAASEEV